MRKSKLTRTDITSMLAAIERIKAPSDTKSNEDDIIRQGYVLLLLSSFLLLTRCRPEKAGLNAFLNSVKRVNKALVDMNKTKLRSNQQAATDLQRLLKTGNQQLEQYFSKVLQEDSRPIEPLHFITKDKPFPLIPADKMGRLGPVNQHISGMAMAGGGDNPVLQTYANVRGPYLTATLQNLAAASLNTARKKNPDAIYKQGTNGIGTYAKGMELAFLAEYDNVCSLFSRDEWSKVYNLTCQSAIAELNRTLRELNTHIKANLPTDCFLAYEIVEIMSNISSSLESRTGELKPSFAAALKPIRETAKSSLANLLEDTKLRVAALPAIPADGASVSITPETITRLQTMVDFLRPISSIMISIGDGGWKTTAQGVVSSDQIPTLNSFEIGADGKQIFGHYCIDTIDVLLTALNQKAQLLVKGKSTLGVFLANNVTIVERMIRTSDLQPLLSNRMADVDKWRKTATGVYIAAWREPCTLLMDTTYTNRGPQRPPSGTQQSFDSAAVVKSLANKEKDAIKEKFRLFNISFDELVAKHKSLSMERDVKEQFSKSIQGMVEPLYTRFWDKYHEIDKGKGKYVKYDKAGITAIFLGMG